VNGSIQILCRDLAIVLNNGFPKPIKRLLRFHNVFNHLSYICVGVYTYMSVDLTVRIPRSLMEKMKRYSEINWSEVVRKSIEEYIRRLEESRTEVQAEEIVEELLRRGVSEEDLEPQSVDREFEFYRRIRDVE